MPSPSPVVIDSSVSSKWIVSEGEERLEQADQVLSDVQSGKIKLFAPSLSKYEIGNVVWKRNLPLIQAKSILSTYYSLPITFVEETQALAVQSCEIAQNLNITYYDACFLALARSLDAPLITDNPRHQAKIKADAVIALAKYDKSLNFTRI